MIRYFVNGVPLTDMESNMGKMSDWSIQLEEDFWDVANKVIGGCEYADILREAWDNYWSDKR